FLVLLSQLWIVGLGRQDKFCQFLQFNNNERGIDNAFKSRHHSIEQPTTTINIIRSPYLKIH
ncbi:unnamed protein product, partial [Ceratitis capitata]